ncbi:uncharacterized protein [Procambarus clarkii]|uniref:uncharacterized protein n=1 Tax=Procambarus clarkii TaxID=6728 RepID=UPI0037430044
MELVARQVLVWACVWACVWAWAASQTLYKLDSYPGSCYLTTYNYSVSVITLCALHCKIQRCVFFTFMDELCEVRGPGLDQQLQETDARVFSRYTPSPPSDVARGKPTLPNFQWDNFVSSQAVDGNSTTQYHSLGTSPSQSWWRVDLGAFFTITSVDILPTVNVAYRFRNVEIRTGATNITDGNFTSYDLLAYYTGPWNGIGRLVFTAAAHTCARYLSVQGSVNFLNIQDLKILA